MSKERGDSPRVHEDHRRLRGNLFAPDVLQAAGHRFARIDRVQDDTLGTRQKENGAVARCGRDPVPGAREILVALNIARLAGHLHTEDVRDLADDADGASRDSASTCGRDTYGPRPAPGRQ